MSSYLCAWCNSFVKREGAGPDYSGDTYPCVHVVRAQLKEEARQEALQNEEAYQVSYAIRPLELDINEE